LAIPEPFPNAAAYADRMSVQKAKYSVGADVFRFSPRSGHPARRLRCPFSAKPRHGELKSRKRKSRPKAALNRNGRSRN
jgi:hypothetical protein